MVRQNNLVVIIDRVLLIDTQVIIARGLSDRMPPLRGGIAVIIMGKKAVNGGVGIITEATVEL